MLRVIVVAAGVWLAGSAHAALQLRDRGTLGSPPLYRGDGVYSVGLLGDGVRYIAYDSSTDLGSVEVLDVISRTRRTIPQFADCRFQDLHHGELLWACPSHWRDGEPPTLGGAVQDLASGRIEILPPPTPALLGVADHWRYTRLGKRFVMIVASGYRFERKIYVDRHTKAEHHSIPEEWRRDWVVDLDGPWPMRKLCRGQRRALDYNDITEGPGLLSTAGQWAATVTPVGHPELPGRLESQRCGAKIKTIALPAVARAGQPVINDRFMAWVEYFPTRAGGVSRMRVAVRVHRSGRIQRSQLTKRGTSLRLFGRRLFAVQDAGVGRERRLMSVVM